VWRLHFAIGNNAIFNIIIAMRVDVLALDSVLDLGLSALPDGDLEECRQSSKTECVPDLLVIMRILSEFIWLIV
jgi:hypothetical protein